MANASLTPAGKNDLRRRAVTAWALVATLLVTACAAEGLPLPEHPVTPEDHLVRATRAGSEADRRGARRRLERLRFDQANRTGGVLAWSRFLQRHPRGIFAEQARTALAQARFRRARRADTPAAYRAFLKHHGDHRLARLAWRLLTARLARAVLRSEDRRTLIAFLKRHPRSKHTARLLRRLEDLDYRALGPFATLRDLETFQLRFPASPRRPIVRRRVAARLAERIVCFGDARDLAGFQQRFGDSPQVARLARRLWRRRLSRAVLDLDASALRDLERQVPTAPRRPMPGARRDPVAADLALLRIWIQRRPGPARQLRDAIRRARRWRPAARVGALVAAAGVSGPRTAVYAIRALAHYPTLGALDAILRGVGSPDSAVSSYAVDALARWARLHRRGPARRLLADRAARLRRRADAASRLTEAALRRTLGDWPRLLAIVTARSWHRPWSVVPHALWLETLPAQAGGDTDRAGRLALQALGDERRKLAQMLPDPVRAATRSRAEAAVFELDRLAHVTARILAKHGARGGPWVSKLRRLAAQCRRQRDEGDRQLGGFPGYTSVLVDGLAARERTHDAGRARARAQLRLALRRLRPPALLTSTLCALGARLPLSCKKGRP